jgi:hypothetical protein
MIDELGCTLIRGRESFPAIRERFWEHVRIMEQEGGNDHSNQNDL